MGGELYQEVSIDVKVGERAFPSMTKWGLLDKVLIDVNNNPNTI